jgi:hypothetical protein
VGIALYILRLTVPEGYTTQWPQDTKGVFRNRKSKDIQHNGHKIPKGYSEAVNRRIYNTMATRYQRGIQKLYGFWIPLWYLVAIVLYILRFTAPEYPFGILWSLCCISFGLRLLNTPLVSCGHCVVYPSAYGSWYLETVNRRIYNTMATRYQRGIQKP